jgi:hypothetical protein
MWRVFWASRAAILGFESKACRGADSLFFSARPKRLRQELDGNAFDQCLVTGEPDLARRSTTEHAKKLVLVGDDISDAGRLHRDGRRSHGELGAQVACRRETELVEGNHG